jgi:hypothetical protein
MDGDTKRSAAKLIAAGVLLTIIFAQFSAERSRGMASS